ncbi:major facilitator superfamily transporter, partial [Aureobasidium melanogenum]
MSASKSLTDVAVEPLPSSTNEEHDQSLNQRTVSSLDVLVQGVALFSDGYNVQIMGYMTTVIKKLYPKALTSSIKTRLSKSILIGEVIGMLLFGFCIDKFGRRFGVIATTVFLVLGITLATASHGTSATSMFWMMIISRGIAGVGAGGEYAKKRGLLTAISTNCAIILGFVSSSIVSLIVLAAYNGKASDGVWRICFGIGIALPLTIFFFRMRLLDSKQYQKHAIKKNYPYELALRMYWRPLLACCTAWFLYDFVVYPFNFLAPVLVEGSSSNQTMLESIGCSALVNAFALTGALLGSLLVDPLGRKETYALGWGIVSVLGFVIGGAMIKLHSVFPLFVVLYGLFQSFLSVGPGNNNFLVSSESFPTPIRGHFLGFAAAVGKAGAAIGTIVMSRVYDSYEDQQKGQQVLFLIGSAISVVGTLVVWFGLPHYLPELETEDARFQAAMEAEGYAPNVEVQNTKVHEQL